ncbi:hypothetical protein OC835_004661, partial [Tilletia horrida]
TCRRACAGHDGDCDRGPGASSSASASASRSAGAACQICIQSSAVRNLETALLAAGLPRPARPLSCGRCPARHRTAPARTGRPRTCRLTPCWRWGRRGGRGCGSGARGTRGIGSAHATRLHADADADADAGLPRQHDASKQAAQDEAWSASSINSCISIGRSGSRWGDFAHPQQYLNLHVPHHDGSFGRRRLGRIQCLCPSRLPV